jgi:hypothetical protein
VKLKLLLGFQVKKLKDAKSIKMSMGTNGNLNLDIGGKLIDQMVYRSMIGSLPYFCVSRPDIVLSICMYARLLQCELKY